MNYSDIDSTVSLLHDLSDRAERLLGELRKFQASLNNYGKQHEVEIRGFRRGVQSEANSLQTIRNRRANGSVEALKNGGLGADDQLDCIHALNSSNLPFYEALWNTAKNCQKITGIGRRVYCQPRSVQSAKSDSGSRENKTGTTVDIIAEDGLKWIKISTINNRRLLFEMAKQGWESYGDYSSDEDDILDPGSVPAPSDKLKTQLDLIKTAETIMEASHAHRVRFRHPQVQFVLPNVQEGSHEDVDAFLRDLKATGVHVVSGSVLKSDSLAITQNVDLNAQNLEKLLTSSTLSVLKSTHTLNLDCTILLALISDISHVTQEELPSYPKNRSETYHKAILRQIECEKESSLLPKEIYPLLEGKALQTTSCAAERMFKIVHTMGTDQEKRRAEIFLGQGMMARRLPDQIKQDLRKYSCHAVPDTLLLPIAIVSFEGLSTDMSLSKAQTSSLIDRPFKESLNANMSYLDMHIARKLTEKITLSKINTSVFLYGWSRDIVTITSNKVVAVSLVKAVDELLDEYEFNEKQGKINSSSLPQSSLSSAPDRDDLGGRESLEHTEIQIPRTRSDALIGFVGPKIHICETARSLIGKEKQLQP